MRRGHAASRPSSGGGGAGASKPQVCLSAPFGVCGRFLVYLQKRPPSPSLTPLWEGVGVGPQLSGAKRTNVQGKASIFSGGAKGGTNAGRDRPAFFCRSGASCVPPLAVGRKNDLRFSGILF